MMKKFILVLIFTGILLTGWSQNNDLLNDAGLILGPGMSHICGGESWDPTVGFMVGAETNVYDMSDKSSIKAGIVLTMQGASYTESYSDYYSLNLKSAQLINDMEYSGKVTLLYLSVPVLYNYLCDRGFYFECGIQPGFLISAKDKPEEGESYDYKDYIKSIDIGIPVGAGYWISESISIGVRAVFGIPNINTEGTEMYSSSDVDRNFLLLGLLRINLNKN